LAFTAGNIVYFNVECDRPFGSRQFRNRIAQEYLLTRDYPDFRSVFEDIIEPSNAYQAFAVEGSTKMDYIWLPTLGRTRMAFKARTTKDGGRNIYSKSTIRVTRSSIPVFETTPLKSDNNIYIETPRTYVINNGQYQFTTHTLSDVFNCYCFGNGVESISVRDEMTTNFLNLDYAINAVSEDVYRQVHRYADLTYSGVYQESTNVNRLNEFNLSLANYKDDLEKRYGPIVRLSSDQTDLLVIQEDRVSKVLYGKDLLYNTDATTNLSRIESVLGQQVIYAGDYGISFHPESFVDYGTNKFFTDTKRGTVMRLNDSNGLEEISKKGMTDYFKKLFRDNTINNIIGSYDSFYDTYVLNIKYNGDEYVTWLYSDEAGGFLTKVSYDPDSMIKLNNEFITFKEGGVFLHNRGVYNRFYNTSVNSSFNINFSQEPSTRKLFKTISTEGDSAWDISVYTDLQNGYINASDFQKKEGVYYAYIRGNQTSVDTATLSSAGIGNVSSINGLEVVVGSIVSTIVSIGDFVYNQDMEFIGIIQDIEVVGVEQLHTLTLNEVNSLAVGDFILSVKSQSVETSGLLGYYMNVMGTLSSPNKSEIYAVNAEISKSFE
jgi:hypothetical protein